MAVTTLARWEAAGTTLAEVERALTEVRRSEIRAAVRTAVLTLVVLADDEDCTGYVDTIQQLALSHPSHALLIVAGDAAAAPRLDADVSVHALDRDGHAVCFEDVILRIDGPALRHLDSVVEPFTLSDLPVALWLPGQLPALGDPLLGAADRVVVDTRDLPHPRCFSDVVALTRRLPVTDLSWIRLAPWRELLAGLFEGDAFRPYVHGVRTAHVAGKEGPRHLVGGWLQARLRLPSSALHLDDDDHVTIELRCELEDGRTGRFRVARPSHERLIEASVDLDDGPCHRRTLRMRDRSPARVLGQALAKLGHDRVYEESVAAAVELLGRS